MKTLTTQQIAEAADELSVAIRSWKLTEGRGEFLVFRAPEPGANKSSSTEGEQMPFWRFDTRTAADRFRNRKIVAELAALKEIEPA